MLNPKKIIFTSFICFIFCKDVENFQIKKNKNETITNFNLLEKDSLKVIAISDGDSFKVLYQNQELKIRIHGIDAPERKMPYYQESKKLLASLIFKQYIYLKDREKDQYQRIVADVFLTNQKNIAHEMVKNGLAWHYVKYSKDSQLANYQTFAKNKPIGIWQDKNAIAPWEFRKIKRDKNKTSKQN